MNFFKKKDMPQPQPVDNKKPLDGGADIIRRQGTAKDEIIKVINNSALFENAPSIAGINPRSFNSGGSNENKSVFYGTGLTTPKAKAEDDPPFDMLGMMMTAEQVRKAGKFGKVIHHIADTHAKTNSFVDPVEVDTLAEKVKKTVQKAARNLGFNNFQVVKSSEFDTTNEYLEDFAKNRVASEKHEYVVREVTDIQHYRKNDGLAVKLGWIIQGTETDLGADERLFDREYKKIAGEGGDDITFLYTKPGRTLDPSRPKVSPYIQIKGENRILLKKGENVAQKIKDAIAATGDKNLGGAIKHLESIVRTYEKLNEPFPRGMALEEKVQAIIDRATK